MADTKISALTASTTAPEQTDAFVTVENMATTPVIKRKAWSVLEDKMDSLYSSLSSVYTNAESLTDNKVLVDADLPIQSYSPTSARNVTLPALATTNHAFYIYNRSATYELTIKTPAAVTLATIGVSSGALFFSDGANGWVLVGSVGVTTSDLQTFTSTGAGTWTKPTTFAPKFVEVICIAGGGGGGGGGSTTGAVKRMGGAGGGGGAYMRKVFTASDLGATESLSVGAGGTSGAGGASGTVGVSGGAGGNSTFGTVVSLTAFGGGGGRLGAITAAAGSGGGGGGSVSAGGEGAVAGANGGEPGLENHLGSLTAGFEDNLGTGGGGGAAGGTAGCTEFGGGGGGGHDATPVNNPGGSSLFGGGGGGCGGGATATPTLVAPQAGGTSNSYATGGGGAAGTGGASPTAGTAGAAGTSLKSGSGGGGGGGTITDNTTGGAGGAGGTSGGGGGGGGCGTNTGSGGAGGVGGRGEIRVYAWG